MELELEGKEEEKTCVVCTKILLLLRYNTGSMQRNVMEFVVFVTVFFVFVKVCVVFVKVFVVFVTVRYLLYLLR
jgi:hypothetical protein